MEVTRYEGTAGLYAKVPATMMTKVGGQLGGGVSRTTVQCRTTYDPHASTNAAEITQAHVTGAAQFIIQAKKQAEPQEEGDD